MNSLAFVVFGDPDRDDFLKAKPYLEWLQGRADRLVTALVPVSSRTPGELDFPGWVRWADAEGLEAVLILAQVRLADLPWAGWGTVEDRPTFFLRPPVDGDFSLLAAELADFVGARRSEAPTAVEFVLGSDPQALWLRVKGGTELLPRMPFLVDYLRQPAVPLSEGGDHRWEAVQLRNSLFEREGALRRARKEAQRYRGFFEDNITGDFVTGPGGRVVDCNRAFARIFGFPSVDYALGLDLRRLFPQRQELRRVVAEFAVRFAVENRELDLVRPDGQRVSVIATLLGQTDDRGRLAGIRGFLFDNTPRKALETQLHEAQKMEGLGRLAGGIAHDFNNLLTVINGYAELLLTELPEAGAGGTELGEILQAGLKASELTRQLLAFSRRQDVTPRILDLNEVVARMETMLRRLVTARISLKVDLDLGPLPILADRGQIEQVILNLALNARDAMPEGGLLTVQTRALLLTTSAYESGEVVLPGRYVRLAVIDTGVGMDSTLLERIFEPFFTTKAQGTGLGLAMVRGIARQAGGHLSAVSEPGKGSTFTLTLDRVGAFESEPDRPPAAPPAPAPSLGVVVVEDEKTVRDYVERILVRQGWKVASFEAAEPAFEFLAGRPAGWSVVVCDLILPGMTGADFVQKLQGSGIDMPFLSMSGYTDDEILRHGIVTSDLPFLHKPFQARELIREVQALVPKVQERVDPIS